MSLYNRPSSIVWKLNTGKRMARHRRLASGHSKPESKAMNTADLGPTQSALVILVQLIVLLITAGSVFSCEGSQPKTIFYKGTLEAAGPIGPGQCKASAQNQEVPVQDFKIDENGSYAVVIPDNQNGAENLELRIDCFGYELQNIVLNRTEGFELEPVRLVRKKLGSYIAIQAECPVDARQIDIQQFVNIARLRPGETSVRIRSSASFRESDESNVLGSIEPGSWITTGDYVKNPDLGNALAILVPVQDSKGQTCRGYISQS